MEKYGVDSVVGVVLAKPWKHCNHQSSLGILSRPSFPRGGQCGMWLVIQGPTSFSMFTKYPSTLMSLLLITLVTLDRWSSETRSLSPIQ